MQHPKKYAAFAAAAVKKMNLTPNKQRNDVFGKCTAEKIVRQILR